MFSLRLLRQVQRYKDCTKGSLTSAFNFKGNDFGNNFKLLSLVSTKLKEIVSSKNTKETLRIHTTINILCINNKLCSKGCQLEKASFLVSHWTIRTPYLDFEMRVFIFIFKQNWRRMFAPLSKYSWIGTLVIFVHWWNPLGSQCRDYQIQIHVILISNIIFNRF